MKKKLFIVEDDADLRQLIPLLLNKEKFHIDSFANLAAFRSRIAGEHPSLIIMDVMLPDGDGIDMCRLLKSDPVTQHIPVLLMSANIQNKKRATGCAAADFIAKPFDIHEFTGKISALAM